MQVDGSVLDILRDHLSDCSRRMKKSEARGICKLVLSLADGEEKAHACVLAAVCLSNHACFPEAMEVLVVAKALSVWLGSCSRLGICLHLEGVCLTGMGDQRRALEVFDETVQYIKGEGSMQMGVLLRDKAFALCLGQQYENAVDMGARALGLLVGVGASMPTVGRAMFVLALCYFHLDRKECAIQYALKAKSLWEDTTVPRHWKKELSGLLLRIRVRFLI